MVIAVDSRLVFIFPVLEVPNKIKWTCRYRSSLQRAGYFQRILVGCCFCFLSRTVPVSTLVLGDRPLEGRKRSEQLFLSIFRLLSALAVRLWCAWRIR